MAKFLSKFNRDTTGFRPLPPFCTYCGGKTNYSDEVSFVPETEDSKNYWEAYLVCTKCKSKVPEPKFIDWDYMSGKMATFFVVIILAICYLIGTYGD